MKPFRLLIPIALALLITAYAARPPGSQPSTPQLPSALKAAADLQITAERMVSNMEVYSISPDGSTFITIAGNQLCTGSTDTFQMEHCIPIGDSAYIDRASVAWSPDNQHVAFTQSIADNSIHSIAYLVNHPLSGGQTHGFAPTAYSPNGPAHDTDIWVLEVSSGSLRDLTSEVGQGIPAGSAVDTQPAWSPDGKTLAFVRSNKNQKGSTALYTQSAQGGKPRKLLTINDAGAFSILGKLFWTGDGKRIVYAVKDGISALYPQDGIWIVDRDGKHVRQLAANSPRWNTPVLLDVSAKGQIALIDFYWGYWPDDWTPNDCYVFFLDLNSGLLTPIKQPAGAGREFYSPMEALFSPDGSKVLYFYIQYKNTERRLAVVDVKGGAEDLLYTSQWAVDSDFWHTYRTLFWSGNDTIYATTGNSNGWVLTLGGK